MSEQLGRLPEEPRPELHDLFIQTVSRVADKVPEKVYLGEGRFLHLVKDSPTQVCFSLGDLQPGVRGLHNIIWTDILILSDGRLQRTQESEVVPGHELERLLSDGDLDAFVEAMVDEVKASLSDTSDEVLDYEADTAIHSRAEACSALIQLFAHQSQAEEMGLLTPHPDELQEAINLMSRYEEELDNGRV